MASGSENYSYRPIIIDICPHTVVDNNKGYWPTNIDYSETIFSAGLTMVFSKELF
jgi:hypothetical protein